MAKAKAGTDKGLQTRSKARAATARASAIPIILLCSFSIAYGIFTHIRAISRGSRGDLVKLGDLSTDQLRDNLNLSKSWPETRVFDDYMGSVWQFFLVIIAAFRLIGVDRTGQALLPLVSVCIVPFCSFFITESLKDGSSALISVGIMIIVSSIGQVITIASASLCLMAPIYAYARWSELRNPELVTPLPSPSQSRVLTVLACNLAAMATIIFTSFVSIKSDYWVLVNIAFQFFPICWMPLMLFSKDSRAISTASSASAREKPRLSSAQSLQIASYMCTALYWYGLFHGFEGFRNIILNRASLQNDAQDLLIWDGLGCLVFDCIVILIDGIVDEAKVSMGARTRVHEKRSLIADTLRGLPLLLALGPGWGMCKYFEKREIIAEKARLGGLTKVE